MNLKRLLAMALLIAMLFTSMLTFGCAALEGDEEEMPDDDPLIEEPAE